MLLKKRLLVFPQGPPREWTPRQTRHHHRARLTDFSVVKASGRKEEEGWRQSLGPWPGAPRCRALNPACLADGDGGLSEVAGSSRCSLNPGAALFHGFGRPAGLATLRPRVHRPPVSSKPSKAASIFRSRTDRAGEAWGEGDWRVHGTERAAGTEGPTGQLDLLLTESQGQSGERRQESARHRWENWESTLSKVTEFAGKEQTLPLRPILDFGPSELRKRFCPAEGGEETPQQRIWFFKNTAKDVDGKRARPPLVLAPGVDGSHFICKTWRAAGAASDSAPTEGEPARGTAAHIWNLAQLEPRGARKDLQNCAPEDIRAATGLSALRRPFGSRLGAQEHRAQGQGGPLGARHGLGGADPCASLYGAAARAGSPGRSYARKPVSPAPGFCTRGRSARGPGLGEAQGGPGRPGEAVPGGREASGEGPGAAALGPPWPAARRVQTGPRRPKAAGARQGPRPRLTRDAEQCWEEPALPQGSAEPR
ncbi:hypothetical protein AB1E18_012253 [Capra hircus]